ncbi:hypothetical protein EJ05DRAFT_123078 [Pseudovirgaria hyperparasitica]|uniref:Uncharacterized protein n=1 Tax=Pseudovirgaria hyperparasitica TaxID=470096 RepID=A0A6A6VXZ8_9PEZI|nr:uncharacterized protein EJ05DRAFT_123078 [Pseudovirgaria hyperparasitica]KAF2755123.1 hypothetical protein EJ05DRAFT_123078 [Pseudovirgaria hyperparasitica]
MQRASLQTHYCVLIAHHHRHHHHRILSLPSSICCRHMGALASSRPISYIKPSSYHHCHDRYHHHRQSLATLARGVFLGGFWRKEGRMEPAWFASLFCLVRRHVSILFDSILSHLYGSLPIHFLVFLLRLGIGIGIGLRNIPIMGPHTMIY